MDTVDMLNSMLRPRGIAYGSIYSLRKADYAASASPVQPVSTVRQISSEIPVTIPATLLPSVDELDTAAESLAKLRVRYR